MSAKQDYPGGKLPADPDRQKLKERMDPAALKVRDLPHPPSSHARDGGRRVPASAIWVGAGAMAVLAATVVLSVLLWSVGQWIVGSMIAALAVALTFCIIHRYDHSLPQLCVLGGLFIPEAILLALYPDATAYLHLTVAIGFVIALLLISIHLDENYNDDYHSILYVLIACNIELVLTVLTGWCFLLPDFCNGDLFALISIYFLLYVFLFFLPLSLLANLIEEYVVEFVEEYVLGIVFFLLYLCHIDVDLPVSRSISRTFVLTLYTLIIHFALHFTVPLLFG